MPISVASMPATYAHEPEHFGVYMYVELPGFFFNP